MPQNKVKELGRERSSEKLKEANKVKLMALVRAKYGNGTAKTSLGTSISRGTFHSDDLSGARTEFKHTVDPCPPGEYVLEGYFEVDESVNEPVGRAYHNQSKKHQSKATKNGGEDNIFSFFEEITVADVIVQETVIDGETGEESTVDKVLGPHDFTVDFEEIAGEKVKILRGALNIYRVNEYEPPVITPIPNPDIPSYPITEATR